MISIATQFESWLCYAALSGLVILAIGSIAVWLCREPIHKVRITQWAFLACLIVPLVQVSGLTPGIEMELIPASQVTAVSTPSVAKLNPIESSTPLSTIKPYIGSRVSHVVEAPSPVMASTYVAPTSAPSFDSIESEKVNEPDVAVNIGAWLKWAWCAIAAMLAAWWAAGLFLRHRITLQSRPASDNVLGVLKSIAGERASAVRVLTNSRIKSPVMWGMFRPTIVIPFSHVDDPQALRWGLAHEWCHVERHDFLTRILAMATHLVCFFQPCFWWLNRELAFNQDLLADAFAAKQGHADEYAAFLVDLSKKKNSQLVPVGLGIAEGRSTIFRRIRTLLVSSRPPLQKVGRIAAVLITVLSIAAITCLGAVRLGAGTSDVEGVVAELSQVEDKMDDEIDAKKVETKGKPTVHYGVVVDAKTSLPIAGAKVHVKRELSRDPKTGKWILLEQTEHVTNFLGVYSFSLSAEQVAQSSLYLEVKTEHPDYQTQGWGGYAYSMIQKNMKKGDLPWFTKIDLQSGAEVSGTIADPEGNPLPNVRIAMYTKEIGKDGDQGFRGEFFETKTNEKGHFRFIAPSPGDGVMWVFPKDYAPQAHRLASAETPVAESALFEAISAARSVKEKLGPEHPSVQAAVEQVEFFESQLKELAKENGIRNDFGTIKMQPGIRLSGKILDAEGNPVAGVGVNLRRKGDGKEADLFLNHNAVASGITGGTMTGLDGTFEMNPLPLGSYRVQIEETVDDPIVGQKENWFEDKGKEKLKHVFAPKNIEITSEPMESITIQAVPHVTIRGQYFDSSGKPKAGHETMFAGQMDDNFYSTRSSRPDKEGRFELRVPKGITEANMNLITNEHSSLRWKLPNSETYSRADTIRFESLDKDIDGLEIIKYEAPIIVIRVQDKDGKPVNDFSIFSRYTKKDEKRAHMYYTGDVGFEKQSDGRWRSSQMLPDDEISIEIRTRVERDRLWNEKSEPVSLAEAQTVTLKEGETRNLRFVVEPLAK